MSMYHYNVHVIASNGNDFTMWVGVLMDHKCDPSDHCCPNDSDLGKAAIARASELCPSVIGWDCEEWNGGDAIAPVKSFKPFFPESYKDDIRELANLFRPFANRMVELGYRLAIDVNWTYNPTILPKTAYCCKPGSYFYEHAVAISTPLEVLANSFELIDRVDLFTLIGEQPCMALVKEDKE